MRKVKLYRSTVKVPISVTWSQELVDDGKGGTEFYIRLTPHINRGGKAGVSRLTLYRGAFWRPSDLAYAKANAQALRNSMAQAEKDAKDEVKKGLKQAINKLNQRVPLSQSAQQTPVQIKDTHAQALERTRRQHGISLEDQAVGEAERKRQEESGSSKGQSVQELLAQAKSEEEREQIRQIAGLSNAGYNAAVEDLNKTKVGYDDDDYYL